MSYARFGENSDVYVIAHCDYLEPADLVCYAHQPPVYGLTGQEMIDHLLEHRANGDNIPDYTLQAIREDYLS